MRAFAIALSLLLGAAVAQPTLAAPKKKETEEKKKKVDEKKFPTDGVWTLTELNGKGVGGEAPTLMIDAQYRGQGFAGCNTYSATIYPIKDMRLAMGPVAMTKKACPADRMKLEQMFLAVLRTGPNWDVNGSDMTIKSQAGSLKLRRGF